MRFPSAPKLEPRRTGDFEDELLRRARSWIPGWSPQEGDNDFGMALLKIAARFSSEVAERLDGVGDKMARGFVDWLGRRGEAARPARMPVVFNLAETAREAVTAPHPVRMQVDVDDTTVTFETETDLRVAPGTLDAVVGVDPAKDAFFLPPPGLNSLEPLDPSPTRWLIKNFAAPGNSELQFDPGLGLVEDTLVEIAGAQYRVSKPRGDLATIEPAVPAGDGFASGTPVMKVEAFRPFDGARNQQDHIIYLGHAELLNIEAEARIEVSGLTMLADGVAWEYWGKDAEADATTDADPRWRSLELASAAGDTLVLTKRKGAVEPTKVGTAEARWIRARRTLSDSVLTGDGVTLRINALSSGTDHPDALDQPTPTGLPPVEVMVNPTRATPRNFYPLGREPRMFDTLYVGCAEAFSKARATAWVQFDLSDGVFSAMSAIDVATIGHVLAGIDKSGTLHLLTISANDTVTRLAGREPMTPAEGVSLITGVPPVLWVDNGNLHVGVATKDQVYVWREVQPTSSASGWIEFGSPPATQSPPGPVSGLVLVDDGGIVKLVALREKRLSSQSVTSTTQSWSALAVTDVAGIAVDIEDIFGARHELPSSEATRFMAAIATAPGNFSLYEVFPGVVVPTQLIAGIAGDVRPFAIELVVNNTLEVVAAAAGRADLKAKQGNAAVATLPVGQSLAIVGKATIGGRLEGGHLAAYVVTESTQPPEDQILVAWRPFNAAVQDIAFRHPVDPRIGKLSGGLTVFDPPSLTPPLAILPGRNKGEIFAARLGGTRVSEQSSLNDLRCAISIPSSPPMVANGDLVAVDVGGQVTGAVVVAGDVVGREGYANLRFFWLDAYLDRPTDETTLYVYQAAAARSGRLEVMTGAAPFQVKLLNNFNSLPACLVIDDGLGVTNLVKVVNFDAPNRGATLDQLAAPVGATADYWLPREVTGRVFPALMMTPANSISWTIDSVSPAEMYFPQLRPDRQKVIAFIHAAQHPVWLAFAEQWDPALAKPAMIRFSVDTTVTDWAALYGDSTANPALSWEYWNGTGWWHLPRADGTSDLRNSGIVKFTIPDDLKPVDWAGKTNHWIRARLIGGDYGREKVVVVTRPGPAANETEQIVNRTTEGIQPPYALEVRVAYAVDKEVAPAFLLTHDSGTLRDQSDANRMPGANIEVFAPLSYTLGRFDGNGNQAQGTSGEAAAKECGYHGGDTLCTQRTVTPAGEPPSDAAQGGGRALYLGFTSKLSGEPVNVLLAVEQERPHDAFAPMGVDALIGDRLVPILASDETRALSESGLVKMSFGVEPMQAELFGRNLFWLRLAPRGSGNWMPALKGAYLNAVWARAAETMTRELVGSSEGEPGLTLALARPPLLHNSLELRVKEPLGREERDQLLAENPNSVVSDAVDLPGDWVLWDQVPDPADCAATDRVYALDEATGTIWFGDGHHGAIPSPGADTIVAFKYERTEPGTGETVPANQVAPRMTLNLVTPVDSVETVFAADQCAGGVAPQSDARVLQFSPARLRHRGRALSARDFEDLALEWSAEAVQARCFLRACRVTLVLVMRGRNPQPSRAQQRELRRTLLDASSPTLAVPGALIIEGPAIRRFSIKLGLVVPTVDLAGDVGIQVKSRLRTYFDTDPSPAGGWLLGATPSEDDIAEALLDVENLESIVAVAISEVEDSGNARPWSRKVGARELALLGDDGIQIDFQIVEAVA